MNAKRFDASECAQLGKNEFKRPWSPPSKLPVCTANCAIFSNVPKFGRKTNTPLLKQSGQPTSGAADNSSRSNNSSQFCNTYETISKREKTKTQQKKLKTCHFGKKLQRAYIQLTNVSASRKTHFSYCVKRQQCNFVNVMPSSGRASNAKLAASFESSTFTSCTKLKTV